jgi:hypothetical protein
MSSIHRAQKERERGEEKVFKKRKKALRIS